MDRTLLRHILTHLHDVITNDVPGLQFRIHLYGSRQRRTERPDSNLKVSKLRLRRKGTGKGGEVAIPAYEAMQTADGLARRMREILMRGVSTRSYHHVIPEMAQTVGISKSSVSREFIEASEEECRRLCERLLKVGARMTQSARRVWVHAASSFPYRDIWILLHGRLCEPAPS